MNHIRPGGVIQIDDERVPVVTRDFYYTAAVTSLRPGAEVVQLLAQVMDSYSDLPDSEREAVVLWFATTYGKASLKAGLVP